MIGVSSPVAGVVKDGLRACPWASIVLLAVPFWLIATAWLSLLSCPNRGMQISELAVLVALLASQLPPPVMDPATSP